MLSNLANFPTSMLLNTCCSIAIQGVRVELFRAVARLAKVARSSGSACSMRVACMRAQVIEEGMTVDRSGPRKQRGITLGRSKPLRGIEFNAVAGSL